MGCQAFPSAIPVCSAASAMQRIKNLAANARAYASASSDSFSGKTMSKERVTEKTPADVVVFGVRMSQSTLQNMLPISSVTDEKFFHWHSIFIFDDGDAEHADEREVRQAE